MPIIDSRQILKKNSNDNHNDLITFFGSQGSQGFQTQTWRDSWMPKSRTPSILQAPSGPWITGSQDP